MKFYTFFSVGIWCSIYLARPVVCIPDSPTCGADYQCTNLPDQEPTRPCDVDGVTDLACVVAFFGNSGAQCSPVAANSTVPDTLSVDTFFMSYPSFKLTAVQYGVTIGGLSSGWLEDFIVDTQTNLLVLTVLYKNVTIEGTTTFVNYESEREPLAVTDKTKSTFGTLELITVFFSVTNPDLRTSLTIADCTSGVVFEAGPCLSNSTHPTVRAKVASFLELHTISGAEGLQTRSPTIQKYFIQENICDYGVNLTAGYGQQITACV